MSSSQNDDRRLNDNATTANNNNNNGTDQVVTIPILDMNVYKTDPDTFSQQVGDALARTGFFVLRHRLGGDNKNLATRITEQARQFFERPLEEKMTISYEHSPAFRGYMRQGVEQTQGRIDLREQLEYAVEEQEEQDSNNKRRWPLYERLRGRNPWPDDLQPTLRVVVNDYVRATTAIADAVRQSMCRALGLPPDHLEPLFRREGEPPHWVLKLISYAATTPPPPPPPTCTTTTTTTSSSSPPPTNIRLGVGAHTDTNFLTLVLQDDVGGLQIFWKQGQQWVDVPAPSDSHNYLVVNIGEQAQVWSRGYFRATPHRVVLNNNNNNHKKQHRISVPLFYNPVLSAVIEPIDKLPPSFIAQTLNDDQTEEETWRNHHRGNHRNTMLASVGENTFKSLARSHPAVFARHHPDLQVLQDGRIIARREETNEDHDNNDP